MKPLFKAFENFHDYMSAMISDGRLTEHRLPQDYEYIVKDLANIATLMLTDARKGKIESETTQAGAEQSPEDDKYRAAAAAKYSDESRFDFDDTPVVSISDDRGAYVACWVWVYDSEAGIVRTTTDD